MPVERRPGPPGPPPRPDPPAAPRGPDVVLDVEFEQGLLYLSLANAGDRPAFGIKVRFEEPFRGLGGATDMTRLGLFRTLEFLPPGKEIRTLLDASAAYFAREEPTRIAAAIAFRDEDGAKRERRIVHDLAVYRDLAYVVRP